MKYRDPKTRKMFADIKEACDDYCGGRGCDSCTFHELGVCTEWAEANPTEATRLMGLEVITDKAEPMEKTDRPRIAWDKIVHPIAVWCKTEEEAKAFVKAAKEKYPEKCKCWAEEETRWGWRKNTTTCYSLDESIMRYGSKESYEEHDYIIISFSELIDTVNPRFTPGERAILREWAKAYPEACLDRENSGRLSFRTQTQSGELSDWLFRGLCPGQSVSLEDIV